MDLNQIIGELQSLATSGSKVPGFRRKVMVDIDRLVTLADELRRSVPATIQEASEVLKQKDSILNLAAMEAQRIKSEAEKEVSAMTSSAEAEHRAKVGESEILKSAETKGQQIKEESAYEAQQIIQDAQRRAYRILNEAEAAAVTRRDGSDNYAREVLFNLEEQLSEVLGQVRRGIDALRIEVEAAQQQPQSNGQSASAFSHAQPS